MPEPRDPLLKVLIDLSFDSDARTQSWGWVLRGPRERDPEATRYGRQRVGRSGGRPPSLGNDPSAGSPTETLLRLLLPLNDRV